MAEINIERKRGGSPLLWILLLVALAVVGWFVYTNYMATPTVQQVPVTTTTGMVVSPSTGQFFTV